MDLADSLVELVEVCVFLLTEAVEPHVLVIPVICDQICVPVAEVFSLKLHRSLDLDLLHATVLWHTIYI